MPTTKPHLLFEPVLRLRPPLGLHCLSQALLQGRALEKALGVYDDLPTMFLVVPAAAVDAVAAAEVVVVGGGAGAAAMI